MPTSIYGVLDDMPYQSSYEADKRSNPERLVAHHLRTAPMYAEQFSEVDLCQEWPGRMGGSA